jgi:3-mercaptopyruvate sulfurtransferase SseA
MRFPACFPATLILTGAAILTACNSAEQPKPVASPVATTQRTPSAPVPDDGARRVTVQQAAALVAQGQAVIVDVRTAGAFAQEHIKGALLIPNNEIYNHLDQLPPDKMIVTYCA